MLAPVVLVRFHDADAGEAGVVEGTMVAAASEAIEPVDHLRLEIRDVEVGHPGDVARELPGYPVHLAPGDAPPPPGLVALGNRGRLRKHPENIVADDSVHALDVPDHVVVQDGFDVPALLAGDAGHIPAAIEPLLLSGETGQDDGGGKRAGVLAQHPGGLDHAGHPAGVVVGPGRIVREVVRVRDAAVDVAGHDHVPVRFGRSPQGRQHVHDFGVHRNT